MQTNSGLNESASESWARVHPFDELAGRLVEAVVKVAHCGRVAWDRLLSLNGEQAASLAGGTRSAAAAGTTSRAVALVSLTRDAARTWPACPVELAVVWNSAPAWPAKARLAVGWNGDGRRWPLARVRQMGAAGAAIGRCRRAVTGDRSLRSPRALLMNRPAAGGARRSLRSGRGAHKMADATRRPSSLAKAAARSGARRPAAAAAAAAVPSSVAEVELELSLERELEVSSVRSNFMTRPTPRPRPFQLQATARTPLNRSFIRRPPVGSPQPGPRGVQAARASPVQAEGRLGSSGGAAAIPSRLDRAPAVGPLWPVEPLRRAVGGHQVHNGRLCGSGRRLWQRCSRWRPPAIVRAGSGGPANDCRPRHIWNGLEASQRSNG